MIVYIAHLNNDLMRGQQKNPKSHQKSFFVELFQNQPYSSMINVLLKYNITVEISKKLSGVVRFETSIGQDGNNKEKRSDSNHKA